VLVKFIRPKQCVKEDPALPIEGRFYSIRQNQQCEEKLPIATTKALKSGSIFTYGIVCITKINPDLIEARSPSSFYATAAYFIRYKIGPVDYCASTKIESKFYIESP
jgi:hypothetical protein